MEKEIEKKQVKKRKGFTGYRTPEEIKRRGRRRCGRSFKEDGLMGLNLVLIRN